MAEPNLTSISFAASPTVGPTVHLGKPERRKGSQGIAEVLGRRAGWEISVVLRRVVLNSVTDDRQRLLQTVIGSRTAGF